MLLTLTSTLLFSCSYKNWIHDSEVPLLSPSAYGRSVQIRQIITITSENTEHVVQALLLITTERLHVALLSAEGQRLATIHYNGQTLELKTASEPVHTLPAKRIVTQLQLLLWPAAAWEKSLHDTDWKIVSSNEKRQLLFQERPEITVHYKGAAQTTTTLVDYKYPYHMTIATIEQNEL